MSGNVGERAGWGGGAPSAPFLREAKATPPTMGSSMQALAMEGGLP